jgi:quinol-cytochrome oxidoreductase complex cytochrome b subunit
VISILAKILGSGDVVSKSLDLIDSMHTSTEEEIKQKADAKAQLLQAYAPFKIAQRMLAFMFGFTYVICFAIVMGMTLSGSGDPDSVTKVMDQFSINYAMLLILGFYFGGGAVEGFMEKKGKK